jgi:tetratricopeptide (TPR) repeat protein
MSANSSIGVATAPGTPAPFWRKLRSANRPRELVLIICFVLLLLMFSVTAVVSRLYHKKIHTLADQWFAQGEGAFQAGNAKLAVTDYQNALVYSPNNSIFQLHLAQALVAAGRLDEARFYLLNLLAESPGSSEINLELARISARQGSWLEAVRYYHAAIYGVWDGDPLVRRWEVRRELCQYLLDRGDVADAQPEVLALSQEAPPRDLQRQKQAAELLLRSGSWARALLDYQSILKQSRGDQDALVGAAIASYQLAKYAQSLAYFGRLRGEKPLSDDVQGMLQSSREVEAADPFRKGLTIAERSRRAAAAAVQASSRLGDCAHQRGEALSQTPPVTDLQKLYATQQSMAADWSESNLARHPDRIEAVMSLAFEMENTAAQQCGAPLPGPDRTLLMLDRSREGRPNE